ncbi:MAG: hypothetical protein PHX86_06140 [Caldisericia bacterium]|nr:hypothetical protein [Caldisericia bacterium]
MLFFIFRFADTVLLTIFPFFKLSDSFDTIISGYLIGSIGFAGLILGLYCTSITSIYSTKYVNAPRSLSNLFQEDIASNTSINKIVFYIIFSLLLLFVDLINNDLPVSAFVLVSLLAVYIIVDYSKFSRRAYWLSDTYNLSVSLYIDILDLVKKVSRNNIFSSNISFQKHFYQICAEKLSVLKDISEYNKNIPVNQNSSMLRFMERNNLVLKEYWSQKRSIYYDSMWFQEKIQYPQWYKSSDIEVRMAIENATPLQKVYVKNKTWFEEEIKILNHTCLQKFFQDKDLDSLNLYLQPSLSNLAYHSVDGNSLSYMLMYIETLQKDVLNFISQERKVGNDDVIDKFAKTIDALTIVQINLVCGLNRRLDSICLEKIFERAKTYRSFNEIDFKTDWFLNNQKAERLYNCIETEVKLENKKITPDWYIEQTISQLILEEINFYISSIDRLLNQDMTSICHYLLEKELYFPSAVATVKLTECNVKIQLALDHINEITTKLKQKNLDKRYCEEADRLLHELEANRKSITGKIPQLLAKCSGGFALDHWENREEYPDLLGYIYNYLCEYLISAIEINDFDKFKNGYANFLNIVLVYQEYVRSDLLKIHEEHLVSVMVHVFSTPMIDYATISGLAIIWGEHNSCKKWNNLVENELKEFVDVKKDRAIEILTKWVELMSIERFKFFLGNRDTIITAWKNRVKAKMQNISPKKPEILKSIKVIGYGILKNPEVNHCEQMYMKTCINKYLPENKQYKGVFDREKRIDNDQDK